MRLAAAAPALRDSPAERKREREIHSLCIPVVYYIIHNEYNYTIVTIPGKNCTAKSTKLMETNANKS